MITDNELKANCKYNPETGIVTMQAWTRRDGETRPERVLGTVADNGYLQTYFGGKCVLIHRLAWFIHHGEQPKGVMYHINGDKTDNRICNLMDVEL